MIKLSVSHRFGHERVIAKRVIDHRPNSRNNRWDCSIHGVNDEFIRKKSTSYNIYILFAHIVYKLNNPVHTKMNTLALNPSISISDKTIQKSIFIMNALENGWKVKKRDESYIFTKRHEGRKKFFKDGYLELFLKEHLNHFMT